ncbi:ubiquinol-cytochrome C chaperone family protein [Afipia birgiae]|uniref:ubiquinol-cytochrome C chaperone family protein n=1 Tax=Afipia birgiae TaxID=151414 RepID=UPI000308BED9|nr:ubiquinol-cytochrome C chaperone family protein [Afipia birgiae]MBX9821668.1 ubiquinol-cytochrome C chaperone family protein [Afipia birgiae]
MLWPFNRFRNPTVPRGTIEAIYGMIVAQAREPAFYASLGVRDTVNGRFDMLILHLWLVLRRLQAVEGGNSMSQALFDRFCADMDDNLREMGVGDLTVPKRMQAFGEAFYGRSAAYDLAFEAGDEELAQALSKNVFNGEAVDGARALASYVREASSGLAKLAEEAVRKGAWTFPQPMAASQGGAS